MPKEQGHFGERVAWNTSKNAKDRSNSATMWADQRPRGPAGPCPLGEMGDMGGRLSCFDSGKDSEKDSGYSEAGSDSVQNDLDDLRSSLGQAHRRNDQSAVTVGDCGSSGVGAANHNAVRFEERRSSIYVIRNLSRREQILHRPLAWAGSWQSLSGPKGDTQLLLIQQPAIAAPSTVSSTLTTTVVHADTEGKASKKGCSSCISGKNHHHHYHHSATKNSYLPILNSYPRIAPHPRKEGHAAGKCSGVPVAVGAESRSHCDSGGAGEGHSQSKRVCTEESVSTITRHLPPNHHQQQQHGHRRDLHPSQNNVRCGSEPLADPSLASNAKSPRHAHHSFSSSTDALGSLSVSNSQKPSHSSSSSLSPSPSSSSSSSSCPTSSSVDHSPYRPRPGRASLAAASGHLSDAPSECSSVRQRRFLNTAEILSRSGLLAITLRTKELQKQSDTTQREIAQLRQHTQLLYQAALAGQQVPNDGSNGVQRLLRAMAQSGSYPGLDSSAGARAVVTDRRHSQRRGVADKGTGRAVDNIGRAKSGQRWPQEAGSLRGVDEEASPPSPLFAPSPEAERMRPLIGLAGSLSVDKDLTELAMTPEDLTFDSYLF